MAYSRSPFAVSLCLALFLLRCNILAFGEGADYFTRPINEGFEGFVAGEEGGGPLNDALYGDKKTEGDNSDQSGGEAFAEISEPCKTNINGIFSPPYNNITNMVCKPIWNSCKINSDVSFHGRIGIFVLVLSILQVLAFFLRPNKDAKIRKYWNMYYGWFGRIALFFGACNATWGIHMASAGLVWKTIFALQMTVILVIVVVLEILLRIKRLENSKLEPIFQ